MDAKNAAVKDREALPGGKVYHGLCAQCHEGQAQKAPSKTFLEMMTPEAIYGALTEGAMRTVAAELSDADRKAVAEYISGEKFGAPPLPDAPRCTGSATSNFKLDEAAAYPAARVDEGTCRTLHPSGSCGPSRRGCVASKAQVGLRLSGRTTRSISADLCDGRTVRRKPKRGSPTTSTPTSGCIRWSFLTNVEVRTPVVLSGWKAGDTSITPVAFFGDLIGRVYAVDATTGTLRWRVKIDEHPSSTITGSPVYHEGRLYVPVSSLEETSADPHYACCTFRGSVVALDAATGRRLWKSYAIKEQPREVGKTKAGTSIFAPSGAAIWNTPI